MEKEETRLRALFHACDTNRSGRIEYDEFFTVCRELQVRESQIGVIFHKLDSNRDGSINFREFTEGFQEVSEMINFEALGTEPDWDEFQQRLGDEARFIPRPAQVAALYQNLKTTEPRLIRQYESVVTNFIHDITLQNAELEKLAQTVKRAQDEAAQQVSELEEDADQRIKVAVLNCQKEEQRKAEFALSNLKHQYDCNVNELQKTVTKLRKLEEQYRSFSPKEESIALKRKINDFTLENDKLRKELLEAQTNIMLLQSEIDTLKSDYADQSLNFERNHLMVRGYTDDRDNLTRQIEMLQSANRKLHDSNDGLRSALETSFSKHNKSLHAANSSPGNAMFRSSPKLCGYQSPQILSYDRSPRSSYLDEDMESLALCDPMRKTSCEVESLTESCFDSGMSTMRDSNEYDSEGEFKHQRNFEREHCAQEAFGGDASDTDVPEIRDEVAFSQDSTSTVLEWKPSHAVSRSSSGASSRGYNNTAFSQQDKVPFSQDKTNSVMDWNPSQAVSRSNSGASSSRRCISAFSPQPNSTTGNFKYPQSEKAFKIVLAGDAAVGKSSFLLRLCKNEFRGNTSATLGVDFRMKTLIVDGEQTVLQLWDTAGQERFRSIAKSYFRRADGVLLLYDVTCEKSFLDIREWVDMIEDSTNENIPIMLVGNKADLRNRVNQEGQKSVPTSYGEKLAMTYNVLFCETSAKDGSNIIEAVLHLAREVRKKADEETDEDSVTNLSNTHLNKKLPMKNCCTT
ncbi:ras and EF-hand domain-containing protein [Carcharodon carcharias]|uniref:ras and EF-hand domain-containing protein n=1 Tax=Carcharodon carcharias TaxID=13397 RepID=UPI001B7EF32F|nr:ras and EF-hand domain-containing protein [Carcharodon carcharias]